MRRSAPRTAPSICVPQELHNFSYRRVTRLLRPPLFANQVQAYEVGVQMKARRKLPCYESCFSNFRISPRRIFPSATSCSARSTTAALFDAKPLFTSLFISNSSAGVRGTDKVDISLYTIF